jgi:hypothetical protein
MFQRQSKGIVLLEETFKRLDLVEKDYFGLLYTDNETGLTVCVECGDECCLLWRVGILGEFLGLGR